MEHVERINVQLRARLDGMAGGVCANPQCTKSLFFRLNRLATNGAYYHPGHQPHGTWMVDEDATDAKAETIEAWARDGLGPEGRSRLAMWRHEREHA